MNYVLIRHKVADFAKWKTIFDAHRGVRQEAGLKEKYLLRDVLELNEVAECAETDIHRSITPSVEMQAAGV